MTAYSPPSYNRAPSYELRDLLSPGGFLRPLVALIGRKVNGLPLDIHLRARDDVQVYCGLTRILNVRRNRNGSVSVSAHRTYSMQDCDKSFLRRWNEVEADEFGLALDGYLDSLKVSNRHTSREGAVQSKWSRVEFPWIPFDREAVLEGRKASIAADEVQMTRNELKEIADCQGWAKPSRAGQEVDQLAVDPKGRLVIAETKDASAGPSSVFYTPFQLLHYVWEWHAALEGVRSGLQALICARVQLGLTPSHIPMLTGGIRPAVCFGSDGRSTEVKARYSRVLEVVKGHLPPGVLSIETWTFEDHPVRV